MRIILSLFLLGHAVAHLPGFLVNLRLRSFPELPFKTTVLSGTVNLGDAGIRLLGLAWLTVAIALGVVAVATFIRLPWWQPVTYVTVGLSIVLCALGWPDTRIGLFANCIIVTMIVFGTRAHWI